MGKYYQPVDDADLKMIEEDVVPASQDRDVDQLINDLMLDEEESN